MRIPRRIDVLGFRLRVKKLPLEEVKRIMEEQDGESADGLNYYGYLDPHVCIVLGKELTKQEQAEVLVHEIGHEVQFAIASLGITCDISNEPIHGLYHRLLVGALLTNRLLRIG